MLPDYSFSKEERLYSKKRIDLLFQKGQKLMVFPYSIHWMVVDKLPSRAQILIVAPKKKLRHAVSRNRVKRLTRECYRLHKPEFYALLSSLNVKIVFSVSYVHNKILEYHTLHKKFDKIVEQLTEKIAASL